MICFMIGDILSVRMKWEKRDKSEQIFEVLVQGKGSNGLQLSR